MIFHRTTTSIDDLTLVLNKDTSGPQQSEMRSKHLPAEWYPQSGIQLTWPHANTDWAPILSEVEKCYIRMSLEIALRERLIIVTPEPERIEKLLNEKLPQKVLGNITFHRMPTNDTWARDHGFITLIGDTEASLLDFQFNGWGKKFEATLDNEICRHMNEQAILRGRYEDHLDIVLEGGSIESDGRGTILTTSQCLMAPNRNQPLSKADIEERLLSILHAQRILWLDHGYLAGDDTDSHVDTLARLCPDDTIAYVQCTDTEDEHYEELRLMEEQIKTFTTIDSRPYRLVPLPMGPIRIDEDGERLPSTYANFLIMNNTVLMPTYDDKELDDKATTQLQKAFPKHDIVGIDCQVLIRQHGSLHCCTMQFPIGIIPSTQD